MAMRITLEGDAALIARLQEMGVRGRGLFKEALEDCVEHVKNRAIEGIANGPKSGRVYTTRFWTDSYGRLRIGRRRTPHQASAAGEYPAADTGNLMRSIWAEVEEGLSELAPIEADLSPGLEALAQAELSGEIGADASYAIPLEYKPANFGGRPFLRKALKESEDFIRERFMALRGRIVE